MKRILANRDPSACTGCRACEVACVAHHERRFGTAAARIHVVKVEALGIDQPHVCRQCGTAATQAPCIAACPVGALSKDERTGAIRVEEKTCIGCAACVDACPFGMAALHPERGTAIICDLCGGDPACVKRCATGAIVYAEPGASARARRETWTAASVAGKPVAGEPVAGASPCAVAGKPVAGASPCAVAGKPVAGASPCAEEQRHGDAAATDRDGRDAHV